MSAASNFLVTIAERRACRHCGNDIARDGLGEFCCAGCEAVFGFLGAHGLGRYYELRGQTSAPAITAGEAAERVDRKWLEPIAEALHARTSLSHVELDVQGMHCSACVWLIDELFRREAGGASIVVNPAVGRADLVVEPTFDLRRFVATVERVGYRFGPPVKANAAASGDLVWRMGVCLAIAMNTMIFGVAMYCGLEDGPVHELFLALNFGLSFVSVAVGGTVFFASAWRALRARFLSMDLPIALGILLAFASSTQAYLGGRGASAFFDTLNVFVALMLVGRFLQERVVARNRAEILASSGAEHVYTRRIGADGAAELVSCKEIVSGDELLVGRSDLVPVDAVAKGAGSFSLDWISGESRPKSFGAGDVVPAGAFSCNEQSVALTALSAFETSALAGLLRTTRERAADAARATPFWQRLSKIYVLTVLSIATLAFAGWMMATGDVARSLGVVTALLIVTCPCAFGIATPLAYELAQAGLRSRGLFVRSAAFLDRAASVSSVVFDKTGTLTTGALRVDGTTDLDALSPTDLAALTDMVSRSAHPKSQAIARAISGRGRFDAAAQVVEHPGLGVALERDGAVYRLGAPRWGTSAAEISGAADVVFAKDGVALACLTTREELRPDAAHDVRELARMGLATWVLSGDATSRARAIASACGIDEARAIGDESPDGKADVVAAMEARGERVLFVGDGINDSRVADVAYASGTPALDRPFMAARTDFYLVTPGLRPVRLAVAVAHALARVVKMNLAIAIAYNVATVVLSIAGLMSPLLCAVLMPLSSLSTVLATTFALSRRSRLWRS